MQKSTLPDKLKRDGTIKSFSGRGVFANQNFQAGDIITQYSGREVSFDQQKQNQYNQFYFLKCPKSFGFAGIDGLSDPVHGEGLGSFINNGYKSTTKEYRPFLINTRFKFCAETKTAWIAATKFISQNEELLLDYGTEYHL
jgi:hypothetical protein